MTTTATYKSTELGRTVTLSTYVDPFPGLKGTDTAPATCGRCGGSGFFRCYGHIYQGKCFRCHGLGTEAIKVSTHRRWARQEAFRSEYAAELSAQAQAAEAAARAAAAIEEFNAAWDAAHQEQARRAALVQGYLAEPGDKVADLRISVKVAKYCAAERYGWSASMFIIAETAQGQVLKFSGSSATLFELQRGATATLTGKVKGHATYQGQQQTVLSHCKVADVDLAPELSGQDVEVA